MKTRTKLLLLILTVLLVTLLVVPAMAADTVSVPYLDETGAEKNASCIPVTDTLREFENDGWYVVNADVTINERIINKGTAHLVLADGAELTAPVGIENPAGKSLTIYGQTGGTGTLTIIGDDTRDDPLWHHAAIGGGQGIAGGAVTINGGTVTVKGGKYAAGIGGGENADGGTTIINGGTVTVTGGWGGAGIGGGGMDPDGDAKNGGSGGSVTINGGKVTVTGGWSGAGIGGGWNSASGGTVTINNGNVEATGGIYAAGIGGGSGSGSGTITINGGSVTANGGSIDGPVQKSGGAGIGCGYNGKRDGEITITGGTVKATGGALSAGIGGGDGAPAGTIVIKGGTVTATGGSEAPGIGGGYDDVTGGSLTVTGGSVTANGTDGGAGIGGGMGWNGSLGRCIDVTITGGTVEATGSAPTGSSTVTPGIGCRQAHAHNALNVEPSGENALTIYAGQRKNSAVETFLDAYRTTPVAYVRITVGPQPTYTVRHLLENANDSGYTQKDSETKTGAAGSTTCAVIRDYEGFTPKSFSQQTVNADGSTVVEIEYDRNSYTVFFDNRGHGETPDAITAKYGAAVSAPADPEAAGYTFGGWFEDKGCTMEYTFNTMPPGSKVLYAKWTAAPGATYTVTWSVDGKKDTTKVAAGSMPTHAPASKANSVFTGWEPALSPVTGDVTYTATFYPLAAEAFPVSFDTACGSFVQTRMVETGTAVQRPADPQKEGCTFAGWFADPERRTAYTFGTPVTAQTTLYAGWKTDPVPSYTVTWSVDGKTDTTNVTEGAMPTHADPKKDGAVFIGWEPALSPVTGDAAYTAKFYQLPPETSDIVKVSFDTVFGSFIDTQILDKGKTAVMPAAPAKEGYTFAGWYSDMGCTAAYDFTAPVEKDTILYAKWTKDPLTPTPGNSPIPNTGDSSGILFLALCGITALGALTAVLRSHRKRSVK